MSIPHFRNRQDRERQHTLGQADLHAEVTTFYDQDRTEVRLALLGEDGQEFYGEGVARLHPGDHYDKALGQHIAFLRAMQEATKDALFDAIDASVTEVDYQRSLEDWEPEPCCGGTCSDNLAVEPEEEPETAKDPHVILVRVPIGLRIGQSLGQRLGSAASNASRSTD